MLKATHLGEGELHNQTKPKLDGPHVWNAGCQSGVHVQYIIYIVFGYIH